jgi:signal transduction histidine kinase
MSQAFYQRKIVWPVLAVPLLVLALALVVSRESGWLEQEVFERLILAFGSDAGRLAVDLRNVPAFQTLPEAALLILVAAAATWAGFKLGSAARLVVLVQLFVLTILVQWALWHWAALPSHPLAYFSAVFLGCLAGYLVRLWHRQRLKAESQYYELLLRNRELNETKLQIVKQDEVERRMLAADLHDQVLNDLKQIRHKLDDYIDSGDPATAESIKSLLGQAMGEIREVMDSLCPSALEHLGLGAAVEDCLRRGSERAGFKGRFRSKVESTVLEQLSMVEQSLLYRLVQESVTNVCKHAQASTVRATMDMEGDHLVIRVADDGRGIDFSKLRDDSRGVRYMRQRADLIGATISWRPGDQGRGTVVEIRMDVSGRKNGQSTGG